MSSHAPFSRGHATAAPTAPEGKKQKGGAFPARDHAAAGAVNYTVPASVEAVAAPPARTTIETTTDNAVRAHASSTTTTRVVTMQPCKIVYHYADNTSHTYVLQSSSTETTGVITASTGGTKRPHVPGCHGTSISTQTLQQPRSGGGDSSSQVSIPLDSADTVNEKPDEVEETAVTKALLAAPCTCGGNHACLAAVYRPPEYAAAITPANPRIGSPGPVTLFAFGFTTCLYNVHQAGICPMNLTTMGLICFYGGLAQFVGGFFELVNKNTIFCTLDVTYGAFWMATAITNLVPENANVTGDAPSHYLGGFFMLWFFFAATMFASSFKFSFVQMLLNFSVALNFLLNLLGNFIGSKTLLRVAGFEGIVEGCLATYVGMAFTMRDVYGHSVLPLFFQKNFIITEW